ncbi:polyprenyl synthetase family protein [Streptomyces sp. NPDC002851]
MTAPTLVVEPGDFTAVREQTNLILEEYLDRKATAAAAHRMPAEVVETLRGFLLAGGKRLRPLLCMTGWHVADGQKGIRRVLRVAAALEMFHAFALIHDDIMDHSHTRRGRATVHRIIATRHAHGRSPTAADQLGAGAAILIGDLALAWSDELLHTAGLTHRQLTGILPLIDAMRTEVMYGQYLDLTATGQPTDDVQLALAVIRYKTAKYTVERLLHIGAALAGANRELRTALSAFALPIGEAFQLRDDLLGIYGTPTATGKPNLDDLRDGKHTTLIALALQRASRAQAAQLRQFLGCPQLTDDQADIARNIITATGAPDMVEQMIQDRCRQAEQALTRSPIPTATAPALRELARSATRRST